MRVCSCVSDRVISAVLLKCTGGGVLYPRKQIGETINMYIGFGPVNNWAYSVIIKQVCKHRGLVRIGSVCKRKPQTEPNRTVLSKIGQNASEPNAVFAVFGLVRFGLRFFIGLVWI